MTSRAALFALFAMWGVATCTVPAAADDPTQGDAEDQVSDAESGFTDRIWVRAGDDGQPRAMHVFLSDGTLVTDSVWENVKLSDWKMVGERNLLWTEDGADIGAEIIKVSAHELVLKLTAAGGAEQRYVAAQTRYLGGGVPG